MAPETEPQVALPVRGLRARHRQAGNCPDALCNRERTIIPYSLRLDSGSPMSAKNSMMVQPSLTKPCSLIRTRGWAGGLGSSTPNNGHAFRGSHTVAQCQKRRLPVGGDANLP